MGCHCIIKTKIVNGYKISKILENIENYLDDKIYSTNDIKKIFLKIIKNLDYQVDEINFYQSTLDLRNLNTLNLDILEIKDANFLNFELDFKDRNGKGLQFNSIFTNCQNYCTVNCCQCHFNVYPISINNLEKNFLGKNVDLILNFW